MITNKAVVTIDSCFISTGEACINAELADSEIVGTAKFLYFSRSTTVRINQNTL